MIDISLPPSTLSQHASMKRGKGIYQDTAGINIKDTWFIADNGDLREGKRKSRTIQAGKGYTFSGIETITYTQVITTIVDQNGTDLSTYLVGQVLTPPAGFISKIVVNGVDYDLEDTSGTISYRSIPNDHATIALNGTSESNFFTPNSAVPSVQNELGYNVAGTDPTNPTALIPVNKNNPKEDVLGNLLPDNYRGKVRYDVQIKGSSVGNTDSNIYLESATAFASIDVYDFDFESKFKYTNSFTVKVFLSFKGYRNVGSADLYGGFLLYANNDTVFFGYQPQGQVLTNITWTGFTFDDGGVYKIRFVKSGLNISLYIDDILISTQPMTYEIFYGTVADEVQVNGFFYGGTQRVGNAHNIFYTRFTDTSTGDELISLEYSETNGLTVFNLGADAPANSDFSWQLNGSGSGTQWSGNEFQYPKNLIEGYWVSTPDDGVKYPYNVGGNKTFVPPTPNVITPIENTYDRNPMNAPELVAMGISQNENISYNDIISDESRFYDKYETKVTSLLAYNDFPEPIAGGSLNADGNIYLQHPNLTGITITSSQGTSTPTISGNDILLTSGYLTELILSDGSRYIFGEEGGLVNYDLLKINNLTVVLNGTPGSSIWTFENKDYHHKYLHGYYFNGTSLVPGDPANFGFAVDGNPIDNLDQVKLYRRIINYLRR